MGHCLFKNIVIHHNVVRHKFQHYVDVFDYEKQKKKKKIEFLGFERARIRWVYTKISK